MIDSTFGINLWNSRRVSAHSFLVCFDVLRHWRTKPGRGPAQVRQSRGHSAASASRASGSSTDSQRPQKKKKWIKVFFLVANSTATRRGRLQTKVQPETGLGKMSPGHVKGRVTRLMVCVCVKAFGVCVQYLSVRVGPSHAGVYLCVCAVGLSRRSCCVSVCARLRGNGPSSGPPGLGLISDLLNGGSSAVISTAATLRLTFDLQ